MTVVAVDVLRELGGVARRAALLTVIERKDLKRAVEAGDVVRDARGRYALPDAAEGVRLAHKYGGALALESAALEHGWAVRTVPREADSFEWHGKRSALASDTRGDRDEM